MDYREENVVAQMLLRIKLKYKYKYFESSRFNRGDQCDLDLTVSNVHFNK